MQTVKKLNMPYIAKEAALSRLSLLTDAAGLNK
jgi:hypothetical protein